MSVLLGIDVGTSATKAVVVDPAGAILAQAERPVELRSPRPGWAEEDPEQWWANVCSLCRELPVSDVAAIGVSGMVPAVILLDEAGRPLRPSIQQNDARAAREVEELRAALGPSVLRRTGSPVTQQSVGPTALWLARNEPEVWAATHTVLGSYDYVVLRLTGNRAVERNWALESGLYELATGALGRGHLRRRGYRPCPAPTSAPPRRGGRRGDRRSGGGDRPSPGNARRRGLGRPRRFGFRSRRRRARRPADQARQRGRHPA